MPGTYPRNQSSLLSSYCFFINVARVTILIRRTMCTLLYQFSLQFQTVDAVKRMEGKMTLSFITVTNVTVYYAVANIRDGVEYEH